MDIGVYISELLARNGEISVPGLGFLMLQKVPGYYNETDGKFYPPRSTVQFDPQQIDEDQTLAQYIAEQKNISTSSAQYFAEKYVSTIREDALVKEVPVGDLGSFIADQGRLIFIPSQKPISNPAFFGLAPVNLAKTLPPPAPISTPPAQEQSFSNFTAPERPANYDFNRPAEPEERRNTYQGNTPYPPPLDNTPPPYTPPPSNTPPPPQDADKNKQALIDAFNANNKGAYAEQASAQQQFRTTRPDLYANNPPPQRPTQEQVAEEEEQKRPIALFILIGLIVVLLIGVFALKKFMPAKFDAIKNIFTHKAAQTTDNGKTDTVKIREPQAVIPPPQLDSAARDSMKKVHARDSVRALKTADSLRKVQKADSIKYHIQAIADAKKRKEDSLENVRLTKIQRAKDKADSVKAAKAVALAAKQEAKKAGKTVTTIVTPAPVKPAVTAPPVATPMPDKNTKTTVTSVQKTVTAAPVATGDLSFATVDPAKSWFVVIGPYSATVASAKIAGLKKIGIDGFAVKKGATIFVAMGAYAKNSEADAASTKFKQSGVPDAYLAQINK